MRKLFAIFLLLLVSKGTTFAWDYKHVQIGDLYYNLDAANQTAEVTYQETPQWPTNNYSSLTTIIIPSSVEYESMTYCVTSIGEDAFFYCSGLTEITIPNSVTSIAKEAFYCCSDLISIVNLATIPQEIDNTVFYGVNKSTSILYVPEESIEYFEAYGWSDFENIRSINEFEKLIQIGNLYYNISVYQFIAEVTYENYKSSTNYNGLTAIVIPETIAYNGHEYSVTSIGESAFRNCYSLAEISIPNSVTFIGESALRNCSTLTEITIPNSITSIEKEAFYGCSSFTSVVIPPSVTRIENGVLRNCVNLTSVTIPDNIAYIGSNAFRDCSKLIEITIPQNITSIGNHAFDGCLNIKSVTWNARNCDGYDFGSQVESFTFGENVETIPAFLCNYMSKLTSVNIPNSVKSIGNGTFYECYGLTSIEIPNSVTSIGENAFYGCPINNFYYQGTTEQWCTKTWYTNQVVNSSYTLYFDSVKVTDLVIPNSVTNIEDYTFYHCNSISSIEIPNKIMGIGYSAFEGCSNIKSVRWNAKNCLGWNFGSQVENISFGENVEVIPASLCSGMSKLTSVTIPNSVTSIGGYAFSGCSGLSSVSIGNSVIIIGESAFNGCSNLSSIEIPNSVTSLGSSAFNNCSGLSELIIPNSVDSMGLDVYNGCSNLISLKISANIPQIKDGLYIENIAGQYQLNNNWYRPITYSLDKLKIIEAPDWYFDVPENFWAYCPNTLENVSVNNGELSDNGLTVIKRSYKTLKTLDVSAVTNIEFADEAFKGLYNLQTLVLPSALEKINYMMVAECVNLQGINIPAAVEEIDQRAFENCRSLNALVFAENSALTKIGAWAFYNCHELANIEIPEGVTEIGNAAFYGCTYLQEAHIPASVQSIGDNAFALCSKLAKMDVDAVLPPEVENKTFYEVSTEAPVYVPDESVETYKSHAVWGRLNIQGRSNAPTAIYNTDAMENVTKIIRDGQIFIIRGDKTYTLTGQAVK